MLRQLTVRARSPAPMVYTVSLWLAFLLSRFSLTSSECTDVLDGIGDMALPERDNLLALVVFPSFTLAPQRHILTIKKVQFCVSSLLLSHPYLQLYPPPLPVVIRLPIHRGCSVIGVSACVVNLGGDREVADLINIRPRTNDINQTSVPYRKTHQSINRSLLPEKSFW